MDYAREFRKYITSHQTSLALRVTISVVLPPILFFYLHLMTAGVALALGALGTSLTDTPGPPHHRRNGFYASIALNCFVAILIGFTNQWTTLLGIEIAVLSFLCSYLSVFGSRAGSVGSMGLLIVILTMSTGKQTQAQVVEHGLLIGLGGVWYAVLSLVLYRLFPYRLAQQAVGESIISTAAYLAAKARFYQEGESVDDAYKLLLKEQVVLQEQQAQVRELLFKTRRTVNETTPKGRILVMMFLDSVDLFEMILSSQQDYRFLQKEFADTGILAELGSLIADLADELAAIGLAVQASAGYRETVTDRQRITAIEQMLEDVNQSGNDPAHLEACASMKEILRNIRDIADRMHRLSVYTHYGEQSGARYKSDLDYTRFITHQPIDRQVFADNLSLDSQVFRHALRLSMAMVIGFIVSRYLAIGHGYWILLSISVILKPLFGSTRKIYLERLGGTLLGAAIGGTLLFFVTGGLELMVFMILAMIVGYSVQRRNYFVFTVFVTIYVLISFHFLYGTDFRQIVTDRVIDTALGACIALFAGFVFLPSWSHETMIRNMLQMIKANQRYFALVIYSYTGQPATVEDFKLARKEAFVALANVSDNFQRVLSEPRSKRVRVSFLYDFVVSSQMFVAHTASLAYYGQSLKKKYSPGELDKIVSDVQRRLENACRLLGDTHLGEDAVTGSALELPAAPRFSASGDAHPGHGLLDQFEIIHSLSGDIENAVRKFAAGNTTGTSEAQSPALPS